MGGGGIGGGSKVGNKGGIGEVEGKGPKGSSALRLVSRLLPLRFSSQSCVELSKVRLMFLPLSPPRTDDEPGGGGRW